MGFVDRGSLLRLGLYNGHPFHRVWKNMKTRCHNPNSTQYKWYGTKGITVCNDWHDFQNFYRDMFASWQPEMVLDRIDPSQPYNKINCRWITKKESGQSRSTILINQEIANYIRKLYSEGQYTQAQIGKMYGVSHTVISDVITGRTWS